MGTPSHPSRSTPTEDRAAARAASWPTISSAAPPRYELLEELHRDAVLELWRARRLDDGALVLLKGVGQRWSLAAQRKQLEREWQLLSGLDSPHVVRALRFESEESSCFLALEDSGGSALSSLMARGPLDLETFLRLALKLASVLDGLHQVDLVHQALRPGCVLVNEETGAVKLCDFARAARIPIEGLAPPPRGVPQADLAYVSPEQTGRMNRQVDYRTDFYSLGVVLWEALVGRRLVASADPIEILHWHLARQPPLASEERSGVPGPVSAIVAKLLSKTAEERYESSSGLRADLERCQREWRAQGDVAPFPLGQSDVSARLLIPQRLYGREREIETLMAIFEGVCQGPPALLLVAGYSGIGKTSLIQELYRPIVRERGHFIDGKFDQFVRNVPFGAVIQAFRGLVDQLLASSESELSLFQARLRAALGPNGGVIAEVIPQLELIIGAQSSPPPLPANETQNRFRLVLQNFVGAVATPDHPLVVFLDDLQWADPATLGMFETLLTSPDVRHLLLIGAYRDNEVDARHPLLRALAGLDAAGADRRQLELGPLHQGVLERMLADSLHREPDQVADLAALVRAKTDGNPFFVIQFLRTLRQEGLIRFDPGAACWGFDLDQIGRTAITDNVVDLMTRKIHRLSPPAQRALTLGAAVGNEFDLPTLGIISQRSEDEVSRDLRAALAEGLVLALESTLDTPELAPEAGPRYRFLHDRVQQAAYALIPEAERPRLHLTVGRLLRESSAAEGERLFDIVHHLNLGRPLMTEPDEQLALARLDLEAARRAKSATAYQGAASYLALALDQLGEEHWDSDYDLSMAVHLQAGECEMLCGRFEQAERHFRTLLERARTRLEAAEVYSCYILQRENQSRYADAVSIAREALGRFDFVFPEAEAEKRAALLKELERIEALRAGRPIASLVDLPEMVDPEARAIMRLLTSTWAPAYVAGDLALTKLLSAIMVRESLQNGNAAESAYGYVTHAITVGSDLGDFASGYELGRLAVAVNERLHDPRHRAKVHHMFSCFVNLWRRPLATCFEHSGEAVRSGLASGDFAYTNYGAFHESWYGFLTSRRLDEFLDRYGSNVELLAKIKMASFTEAQKVILNWARALRGQTEDPLSLSSDDFSEPAYLAAYGSDPFFMTFLCVVKLHLAVVFGQWNLTRVLAADARRVVAALGGTIWPPLLDFLDGLGLAIGWGGEAEERVRELAELERIAATLTRLAEHSPENFGAWASLIAAELEHCRGRDLEAIEAFDDALRRSREGGAAWLEALATERCARFWQERGNLEVAELYLQKTHQIYAAWGADRKAQQLRQELPALGGARDGGASVPVSETPSGGTPADELDLETVQRAATAIAFELELEGLLRRLVRLAIASAGAQRGVFLREQNGRLTIEAESSAEEDEVTLLAGTTLGDRTPLCQSIVSYVLKTGQSLVLGNAPKDERFARDPYLATAKPLSILCLPLVHQGLLGGILYLENALVADAFTADRLQVLKVLAAEAALALRNAQLYAGMKQEVEQRRRAEEELRTALAEVETLKNRLQRENVYLQEEIRSERHFDEPIGRSRTFLTVMDQVRSVAPTDTTVLINGETGTGKELIARALHELGRRRDRPLIKVNCAAISAGLVESELFGHVKGAFTGAHERRVGRFEVASGGTLFLDEVGELPLETQVKLLRVLQEHELEPVGSNRTIRVDVRIIAATNRDLADAVEAGRFRSDLYYRLNVFPIRVPPLRERPDDIGELATYFLVHFARQLSKPIAELSPRSLDLLQSYPWPGNVRELQNVLERAVVLAGGPILELGPELFLVAAARASGPAERAASQSPPSARATEPEVVTLGEAERRHILAAVERSGGRISGAGGAAELLGLHANTLRSRMKKLGLI